MENKNTLTKIYIKDLLLPCIIGAGKLERQEKQPILINVVLWLNADTAIKTDDIKNTINYKEIYLQIIELTEQSSFYLLERLGSEIADICLSSPLVKKAKVKIEKSNALKLAASAGVEIERTRENE